MPVGFVRTKINDISLVSRVPRLHNRIGFLTNGKTTFPRFNILPAGEDSLSIRT